MSNTFAPFDYLYLNPELTAFLGIVSIENAITFYTSHSNQNLATNSGFLPSNFNSEIFLSSSRDLANISELSSDISLAMSNQGLSPPQIARKQKYVANIYNTVTYLGSNTFSFTGSNTITSNNLNPRDAIRVVDALSTELFFKVSSVSNTSFTVDSNINRVYQSSNYLLYGINVTDYDRIAQINYMRIMAGFSNLNSAGDVVSASASNTNFVANVVDSTFNAPLYRMLYPDARALDDVQTYLDWVNKRKNEVYRIINVDDIASGNGNRYVNMNFLNISSNVVFRSVFIDGVTSNLDPGLCNVPGDSNKLITENAIKYYTDVRMSNLQNQGSFTNMVITDTVNILNQGNFSNSVNIYGSLYVNSNSSFSNTVNIMGSTYIRSNLDVTSAVTMRNSLMLTNGNATFSNGVLVNGSMSVTGNLYNARIGLGYIGSFLTGNNGSNIVQAQNYNDNSDIRIKKDIHALTPHQCLEKVCQLSVNTFKYNYGHEHMNKKTTGFLAQELESASNLSEYIYHTEGFLPDVMKKGILDGNYLYTYEMDLSPVLAEQTNVKIIFEDDSEEVVKVQKRMEKNVYMLYSPNQIRPRTECFIYGHHTNALRNVDYKQLFVLALGAIKQLKIELDERTCTSVSLPSTPPSTPY